MAAEEGHAASRVYRDQAGNFHLNGAAFYNDAEEDISPALESLDQIGIAELEFLDGALAGAVVASKTVVYDAAGKIVRNVAAPAGAGTNQGNATAITKNLNAVTGADGTVGVILPVGAAGDEIVILNTVANQLLKVYPETGGNINGGSANASVSVAGGKGARFICTVALSWKVDNEALIDNVLGVGARYKIARSATPVAVTGTSDVVTGLATVIACFANAEDDLDGTNLAAVQAVNTGGAGHILLKAWKVTDSTHPALIAASAAKNISWIAIGT